MFDIILNKRKAKDESAQTGRFGIETAKRAQTFHSDFPEYEMTPLVKLDGLASYLGVKSIYVKDESRRFGLNAFKALGGSYAVGRYIAKRMGTDISELSYEKLTGEDVRRELGDMCFVTATDGNHGRGVAWTANRLGQKSVVYMPKGTAKERLDNILALGSDAQITDLNYDDAVRLAKENAAKFGWVLIQDTSSEGYEEIPEWIMQGYTTMAYEAYCQLKEVKPTHIFLQAGVGSMAAAVCGFFRDVYRGADSPVISIVEPNKADCLFRTAKANDGRLHFVTGDMDSIMAGLCCGEPCSTAWTLLHEEADSFISVPDSTSAKGMRMLGNPTGGDEKIISGESGAVTLGLTAELMKKPQFAEMMERLGLDENSVVLCFSTEGATDVENYRRIVWDGLYSNE